MCGICCVLDVNSDEALQFWKGCIKKQSRLCRRGPDGSQDNQVAIGNNRNILLSGHILHLRGHMTRQPLKDKDGNFLLWNGEIFGGDIEVSADDNDTAVLLSVLSRCTVVDDVLSTLSKVQGPWSVIFWQEATKCLWFGRDMFGRRSLLWHLPKGSDDKLIISSSQIDDQDFQEIPSVGLFCIKFQSSPAMQVSNLDITLYPRQDFVWPGTMDQVLNTKSLSDVLCGNQTEKSSIIFTLDTNHIMPDPLPKLNKVIPTLDDGLPSCDNLDTKISSDQQKYLQHLIESDHVISKLADQLITLLQKSVTVRTYNQPLLKQRDIEQMTLGPGTTKVKADQEPITDEHDSYVSNGKHDLSDNSSAGVKRSCDSTESSVSNIKHAKPADTGTTSTYRDSMSAQYLTSSTSSHRQSLSCSSPATATVSGSSMWDTSDKSDRSSANVAILFSGGIDSAVLAALVDRCLPEKESVDLINVAFEQNVSVGKQGVSQEETECQRWSVPDRQTGYSALAELNPNRTWNFVEVNVTLQELQKARSEHVRHLVYPSETVLDDSIGCAVWFAARGEGVIGHGVRKGSRYTSSSRVILCGMGADEQFAGYSRHRGKFEELGWQGLVDEIELEVTRISARNLGRDDRVITDHGKESRFPFLDENVVEFLSSLPMQNKADLNLPRGLGEKLLLRVCATKLGLKSTAVLPKRAIQFGSRIAKLENSKEKASDKCNRLKD